MLPCRLLPRDSFASLVGVIDFRRDEPLFVKIGAKRSRMRTAASSAYTIRTRKKRVEKAKVVVKKAKTMRGTDMRSSAGEKTMQNKFIMPTADRTLASCKLVPLIGKP